MKKIFAILSLGLLLLPAPAEAIVSLTLDQAIGTALKNHPSVRIGKDQVRAAEYGIADAQAARVQASAQLVALDQRSQAGLLNSQLQSNASSQNTANATLGLTVPLFTGFKLSENVRAAEKTRDEALFRNASDQADLAYQVSLAFYEMYRKQLFEGLRLEALEHAKKNLELTRKGYAIGRTPVNEVDRVELSLMTSQGDFLQSRTQSNEAKSKLAALLDIPCSDLSIDATNALDKSKPGALSIGSLLETIPRIKEAQAKVEAQKALLAAAKGDLWPQLSLESTYQHGNNPSNSVLGMRSLSNSYSGTWDIRLSTSLNLWDGGRTLRNVLRSEGSLEIAQSELAKTRQEIRGELEQIDNRLEGAYERIKLADHTIAVAERTLAWIEKRYEQGYALQVDVNEVRSNWISAKTQSIDALIEYQLSRAELKRSLGSL